MVQNIKGMTFTDKHTLLIEIRRNPTPELYAPGVSVTDQIEALRFLNM